MVEGDFISLETKVFEDNDHLKIFIELSKKECIERKTAPKSEQNESPKTAEEIEKDFWPKYTEFATKIEGVESIHKFDGSNFDLLETKALKLVK